MRNLKRNVMITGIAITGIITICLVYLTGPIYGTYLYHAIFDVLGIGMWLLVSNYIVNQYLKKDKH